MARNGTPNGRRKNGTYAPGTNGGAHGVKGRSGPKPLSFKLECERLTDEVVLPKIAAYLAGNQPRDDAWRWAARFVADYAKGKPAQTVTHQGNPEVPLEVTVQHRQELVGRLNRIAARFATGAGIERAGQN